MMNSSISAMNDIYLGLEGAGLAPTREAKGLIVNISGKGGWGLTSVPKEIYEAVKAGATDPRPEYAGVRYDDVEQDGWPVNYIRNGEKFLAVNLEGIGPATARAESPPSPRFSMTSSMTTTQRRSRRSLRPSRPTSGESDDHHRDAFRVRLPRPPWQHQGGRGGLNRSGSLEKGVKP